MTEPGTGPPGVEPVPPPRLDARRLGLGAAAALAVGAVVIIAIGRVAGFTDLTDTLDTALWPWLVLCALGQMLVFAGYAGAFRHAVAFDDGPTVPPRASVRVVTASFAMTQLVAAGGAAGLAFTYWALRSIGFATRAALVRLIALNTSVYLVFALIAWLAAGFALLDGDVPLAASLPWLGAVPMLLLAARWFTAEVRVEHWTNPDGGRVRDALAVGVGAAAWVRRAVGSEDGRPLYGWALVYWLGDLLSLGAALLAFRENPGPVALAVAYTTGYLAQSVPIPFVATGGVDAATTATLTMVGVPIEAALLGVVTHRIFAFWLPIGPGLWSAVSLTRHARRGGVLVTTPPARGRSRLSTTHPRADAGAMCHTPRGRRRP